MCPRKSLCPANYCIRYLSVSSSLMRPNSLESTLVQISVVDMLRLYHAALSIGLYYILYLNTQAFIQYAWLRTTFSSNFRLGSASPTHWYGLQKINVTSKPDYRLMKRGSSFGLDEDEDEDGSTVVSIVEVLKPSLIGFRFSFLLFWLCLIDWLNISNIFYHPLVKFLHEIFCHSDFNS